MSDKVSLSQGDAGVFNMRALRARSNLHYGSTVTAQPRSLPRASLTLNQNAFLVSDSCCGSKPLPASVVDLADFKPAGSHSKLGDLPVYVTKPDGANPDLGLIIIYDILGHGHPNNTQAADILAKKTNCVAILPDVFRGVPFPPSRLAEPVPPGEEGMFGLSKTLMSEIMDFVVNGGGAWDKVVKKDVENVIAHLKEQGVKKIGMV